MVSEQERFMLDVLRLFSLDETDCYSMLFWRCKEAGGVEFFVIVNDVFWWATADLEPIMPKDLPVIRQAIEDVRRVAGSNAGMCEAFELWAARKRKMRPQQPAYPQDERLRALFDECGPERAPTEEG